MQRQYDSIGESGLQFFGKVSASISHELKNILAIINENAGLLEDLTFAAQRGKAIDPEKLNRTARNFLKQINRADEILKNMNRFAHSIDQFSAEVNFRDLVELVVNLAQRRAAMRKVILEMSTPQEPLCLTTNPFLLENLVWLCLEFAITATSEGQALILTPEKTAPGFCLHIDGIDQLADAFPAQMPAGHEQILAALGAGLAPDFSCNRLTLQLS
jgi:C4-dicarboxylate-specific signal transduction histidine kinase